MLFELGWRVVRIWDFELLRNPDKVVSRLIPVIEGGIAADALCRGEQPRVTVGGAPTRVGTRSPQRAVSARGVFWGTERPTWTSVWFRSGLSPNRARRERMTFVTPLSDPARDTPDTRSATRRAAPHSGNSPPCMRETRSRARLGETSGSSCIPLTSAGISRRGFRAVHWARFRAVCSC